jgi:CubicO group peptidase (beta-lactamase class C family)
MTRTWSTIFACMLILLRRRPSPSAPIARGSRPPSPRYDRLVQRFMAETHVPGAAWGIIVDGELAHAGAFGERDRRRRHRSAPRRCSASRR